MMPAAKGMSHMIPNHILRVGQTVCLETAQKTVSPHPSLTKPSSNLDDPDFEISLDNLNQLILELDPTFEPIHVPKSPLCISPPTGTVRLWSNFAWKLCFLHKPLLLFSTWFLHVNKVNEILSNLQRCDTAHNKPHNELYTQLWAM